MRTLRFIVDGQILKPDPNCDFENLVPGSEEYVKAEFVFTGYDTRITWGTVGKAAEFYSRLGKEYEPKRLVPNQIGNWECTIPAEALKNRFFKIRVIGKRDKTLIKTNKLEVKQNGGKT